MIAAPRSSASPGEAPKSESSTECEQSLLAEVVAVLRDSPYFELSRLDCRVSDGRVEMRGILSSYFLKQMAQEAVLGLNAAKEVQNLVQVQWPDFNCT
jgi:hypothetical protein